MELVAKPRSKSAVWLYFGLQADARGQPLNSREAVCRLCAKVVRVKSGNTTNLRSHLRRRHRAAFCHAPAPAPASCGPQAAGLFLTTEELSEDAALLQSVGVQSSYVPDAALPPGEPWLRGGASRARLSLPSCLRLSGGGEEAKVVAGCFLQQGIMFGPFAGELCRGRTPPSLRYAWAIRDDDAFSYIDASDENKANWMRFVTYSSSEDQHNLVVFQFYRHIYYRVSRPVAEGAELRVWMGKDYASLLGLGTGENLKCQVGDKESALRPLQDIQLVTLPDSGGAPLWSDRSQSQSPETAADPDPASSSPSSLLSIPTEKHDFLVTNSAAATVSPWYFFGLEPEAAVCKLCLERVGCGGGAADLQNHLTAKHRLPPPDGSKESGDAPAAQQRPLPPPPPVSSSGSVSTLSDAIANFLVVDLQPPALMGGVGFQQLVHALLPSRQALPSPRQLEDVLRERHVEAKAGLLRLLVGRGHADEADDYMAPIEFEPRRRRDRRDVTLSADVWLHGWQEGSAHYLTLWAHFIDGDLGSRNAALATQRLGDGEESSRQAVERRAQAMARDWGISTPKLMVVGGGCWKNGTGRRVRGGGDAAATGNGNPHPNSTTFLERDDSPSPDEASDAAPSGAGPPAIPCFFGAVRSCVGEAMLHPAVAKTLRQFHRFLSTLFPPPPNCGPAPYALQALTEQERAELEAWARRPPTWNKLYPALGVLLKHRRVLVDLAKDVKNQAPPPEDSESSSSAISTSNAASSFGGVSASRCDWRLAEELALALKPLDVACRTLAKEDFPCLSMVKPVLTGLLERHLAPRPADSASSSVLKEVKKLMRRRLASCYQNAAVSRALSVACSLDPRFHGLSFMKEKEQSATYDWLKKETARIAKGDRRWSQGKRRGRFKRSPSPSQASPESDGDFLRRSKRLKEFRPISFKETSDEDDNDAGVAKSSESGSEGGISGMEFLLGDLFCPAPRTRHGSVEESLDLEVSAFRAHRGAWLGAEPLQWWRTKAGQFPLLATSARAYLAAPAAAGNAARDFLEDSAGTRKRSNIPPESLDAMLFLHHNNVAASEGGATATASSHDKNS
ncbi:unnamed protein product [Ophioblennius macclurei]